MADQLEFDYEKTKRCTKCHAVKTVTDFTRREGANGRHAWCRACLREYYRSYERRRRAQGWKKVVSHEGHRRKCLKSKYGITVQDYDRLFAEQGGVCCICGGTETGNRYGVLEVDHDHRTKRVRGLVCHPCNNAVMWYESARAYRFYDKVVKYCSDA